jgi:hypothetical protein
VHLERRRNGVSSAGWLISVWSMVTVMPRVTHTCGSLPPLGRILATINPAFGFGQLGYDLVEKRGLTRYRARTYSSFGNFVVP